VFSLGGGLSWCDVIFEGVLESVTLCDRRRRGVKSTEKSVT